MALSWEQNVYSKMAQSIGYDADAGEMIVTWSRGKTSIFEGVPEELARRIANAPSVGQMINSEIKGKYVHRYG